MVRAPCCDKVGLNRGPWTPEEDRILISFIEKYGHSNWRALPKQAGLLRCGKSCRLRWMNYLKPDIKRGNFSKEEEDTIIQLHEMMGNRWSAIAARLPGRTDNEIKNVWHTHLKRRLDKQNPTPISHAKVPKKHIDTSYNSSTSAGISNRTLNASQQSDFSDDFSSLTDVTSVEVPNKTPAAMDAQKYDAKECELLDGHSIIDDTFWSVEEFSHDDICMDYVLPDIIEHKKILKTSQKYIENASLIEGGNLDFWLDVFVRNGGAPELPEF